MAIDTIRLLWNAWARQGKPVLRKPLRLQGVGPMRVNYDLADGDQNCYPQMLAPWRGTAIVMPERGRGCKRGMAEIYLTMWIKDHGLENFYDSQAVRLAGHRYEPDLVYADVERGIFIDIENDEPYTYARHLPTHVKGRDDERNRCFTSAGWVVLRFSERQVLEQTAGVVRSVMDVVCAIAPDVPMPAVLQDVAPVQPEPRWDYATARRMAATHASASYQNRYALYRIYNLSRSIRSRLK